VVRWNASVMVDAPWDFDLWKDDALNFVFFADGVAAVRLALASGRPLLLRGPHGSGKTSFAVAVARVLGAELHALQLRSTSSVADLLYRFDQTRSLHDAQMLATIMPAGMLFVPSIGGISHHWTENTADADIVTGAQVFVDACRRILGG